MSSRPVVFSGPSGAGKSTLVQRLMAEFRDCFAFSISHTTRNPRPGETDGKEYYFVSRDDMLKAIANDEFVESAEFSGNMYGTSKKAIADVMASARICILDIDMQGVQNMKRTDIKPKYIFVKPPSLKSLEDRLRGRGTETDDSLAKRLDAAKAEMEYAEIPGNYDHIIVNNNLDLAYEELKNILSTEITTMMQKQLGGGASGSSNCAAKCAAAKSSSPKSSSPKCSPKCAPKLK